MKVAIISDTHFRKHPEKIIGLMNKYFNEVDMIIHAGDYTSGKVVSTIKQYKNFVGVWGNNDNESIREMLKEKEILNLKGYSVGICHGHGDDKTTQERALEMFKDDKVDIIIFGHSHKPLIITKNDILMLNPGSLSSRRKEKWHSYIILELEKDCIRAEINFFN